MKITYIAKLSIEKSRGVSFKIRDQLAVWRGLEGEENVALILLDKPEAMSFEFGGNVQRIFEKTIVEKYFFNKKLYNSLRLIKPDVVYVRFSFFPIINLLHFAVNRMVLELNTRFEFEVERYRGSVKKMCLLWYYKMCCTLSFGLIAVTPECFPKKRRKRSAVVGNTIAVAKLKSPEFSERIQKSVVFIGSPGCSWHGVDKLLNIAADLQDYTFHVIGYEVKDIYETINLKELNNVKFYGYLKDVDYFPILKKSFVAIGSLAMERNSMYYSSSLKNREYLSFGLPVIMQGEDISIRSLDCVYSLPMDFHVSSFSIALKWAETAFVCWNDIKSAIGSETNEGVRIRIINGWLGGGER